MQYIRLKEVQLNHYFTLGGLLELWDERVKRTSVAFAIVWESASRKGMVGEAGRAQQGVEKGILQVCIEGRTYL